MPKRREDIVDKRYSDLVYAWFQINSEWDGAGENRWIMKRDASFIRIAEELGMSRQTVSIKVKNLLKMNDLLIYNNKLKRYEIIKQPGNVMMLIEHNTLRKMVSSLNENTINVYIYLLSRFLANDEEYYEFSIRQIKEFIGIGITTRSNDYIVSDILDILRRIGLIEYKIIRRSNGQQQIHRLTYITNHIED